MKRILRRIVCVLLVMVTVGNLLPVTAYAATTPSEVSASTAAQRVEILRSFVKNNSYGYSYFTTTGSACADTSANHGCTKCLTSNLITTTWIKNSLGLLPNSDALLPSPRWASPTEAASYGKVGKIDAPAYSCIGFTMIAHWFIYAQKSTDNIAAKHVATIDLRSSNARATLEKYARVGDMLIYRTALANGNYAHGAIYTGCSSSGITVLDSNWGGSSGPTCKMQEHTINYSTYRYVEISRATNASDSVISVTGISVSPTSANINVGATKSLSATVSPSNATNKAVMWSSSNTSIATVSSSGVVTGVNAGSTTITATTADGAYKASCNITVTSSYSVTYNANGGENAPDAQTKIQDVSLTLSSVEPQRDGYNFKGWATSSSATSAQYSAGSTYTANANVTLYAVWEAKTYTVQYDANGGTGAPDSQTETAGSKLTLSTTIPTRTNGKFMSWQDQNGDTYQPGTEITVESNLTLEAIWALKFVEDGQYVQLDESSYAAPGCIVNVPVLIKNFGNPTSVDLNATFIGHKDIGNNELSTEGAPEYIGYTPSSAIELREDGLLCVGTAQFKIPESATLGERFFILITDVDLTITDQYGELQVIQNGINVWDGSEAESNSLYRVYANTVPTYTIAYIANGGTGEPNDQTKSQGESVCLSTQIPTKEGYLFKGWIIRGILYAPGDEYTEDSDAWAFAVWEEKTSDSYTVSFNANGGSGTMNSVTGISGDYTLPANGFIAPEGKQFKGWATSPSGAVITGTSYNVTANTTFYAVWEEIPTSDSTTLQIGKAVSVRGKEVVIPISLTNNTGIASMNFKIEYDKTRLQLTGFGDAQMAGWMVGVGTGEKAIWVDENGSSANGDILLLRFMVLDTAEDGLAEITVTGLDVVDIDEKDVPVTVVSGGIEVISRIPGDSNDDGNVSAADVLRLKKYLAGMEVEINPSNTDVTGDGRVSAADLLRLKKYFAGMDVVLE